MKKIILLKLLLLINISLSVHAAQINEIWNIKTKQASQFLVNLLNNDSRTKQCDKNNLDKIVQITQKFWLRKGERWHEQEKQYHSNEIENILKESKFYQNINPTQNKYDVVVIFGATGDTMRERLEFLKSLKINYKKVVLLGSGRSLSEGPANDVKSQNKHIKTEADLLLHLFKEIFPNNNDYILINSSNKAGKRANTLDTITDWQAIDNDFKTYKSALFISSQPYVMYQDTIARNKLSKDFSIETVGRINTSSQKNVGIILDTIARTLYTYLNQK